MDGGASWWVEVTHAINQQPQPSDGATSQMAQPGSKVWEGPEKEERELGLPAQEVCRGLAGRTARLNASPGDSQCSFSL